MIFKKAVRKMPTAQEKFPVQIRWMIRRDISEILAIEQASFDFGWTEEYFLSTLCQPNYINIVAEHDNKVTGFMIYELYKNHLHIMNFAVHPNFRRRGVGRTMVEKIINKLSQRCRKKITLELRETNVQAQIFFQLQGFMAVGVLRQHYEDSGEDAYLMQYRLSNADQNEKYVVNNRISKFVYWEKIDEVTPSHLNRDDENE